MYVCLDQWDWEEIYAGSLKHHALEFSLTYLFLKGSNNLFMQSSDIDYMYFVLLHIFSVTNFFKPNLASYP